MRPPGERWQRSPVSKNASTAFLGATREAMAGNKACQRAERSVFNCSSCGNMEEWGASADIEAETIRAIVKGFADGRVNCQSPHQLQTLARRGLPHTLSPMGKQGGHPPCSTSIRLTHWRISRLEHVKNRSNPDLLATGEAGWNGECVGDPRHRQ